MNKLLRGLSISTKAIFIVLFSTITIVVYFALAFVIGWEASTGVQGTDTLTYLSRLKYLADYFPHYPFWDPIQGGGLSATHSYPILTHTIVIVVSKLTGLNLIEALKLVGFSAIPLFAMGVFTYAWVRFRNAILAFMAGFFYILSPIAWIFLFEWGFYAEVVAAVFFPFTVLFFDLFITRALDSSWVVRTRVYFILTVVFLSLSFLAHPTVFIGAVSFMVTYGFFLSIFRREGRLTTLFSAAKYTFLLVAASILLSAFWFVPFYQFQAAVGTSAVGGEISDYGFYEAQIKFKEVFSFRVETDWRERAFNFRHLSFPLGISILYFIGIISVLLLKRRKDSALFVSSFLLILASTYTPFIVFLAHIPFMAAFASWRSFIYGARMFVPVAAAFGAYGLFSLLFFFFKPKSRVLGYIRSGFITILAVTLTTGFLFYFWNKPNVSPYGLTYGRDINIRDIWSVRQDNPCAVEELTEDRPYCLSPYFMANFNLVEFKGGCAELEEIVGGIENLPELCFKAQCAYMEKTRGGMENLPELCLVEEPIKDEDVSTVLDACERGSDSSFSQTICKARIGPLLEQLTNKSRWLEKLAQFPQTEKIEGGLLATLDQIPDDNFIRYDSSPNAVIYAQLGPYLKPTVPQLNTYLSGHSLVGRLWGYYISNLYIDDPVFPDASALPELLNWFGVKNMISGYPDPVEKYEKVGFRKKPDEYFYIASLDEYRKTATIYEYKDAEPIVAVSNKPSVLVIGREDIRVYDSVFKKAPFGFISYAEAFLVKGRENVDDHSLEELKKFDVLFLHGYKYKSRSAAWRLLDAYVKQGGRLFVDTGWQFTAADWDAGETAEFFPTTELSWTDFGKTSDYRLHDGLINTKGIETSGFEPLIWNDQPWGVSSGDNLRSWAEPILAVNGHPLVAGGQYGRGRVVWSGMNLLGHIPVFDSKHPEMIFAARLIDWLLEGHEPTNFKFGEDFTGQRPNPDKVIFTLNTNIPENTSLYFKEAYYPRWRARLIRNNAEMEQFNDLKIYIAGPGFMLVQLPQANSGDIVEFIIVKPWSDYLATAITLVTVAGIIIYLVMPRLFERLLPKFKIKIKNPLSWGSSEEEKY